MILLKPGVETAVGVHPSIWRAIGLIHLEYQRLGLDCVITSLFDGEHSRGSLHYRGRAVDVRTRHVPADALAGLVSDIDRELGGDYDVVLEDTHLHVEYDPPRSPA